MLISKDNAQKIVEEMERIIHKDINMMDARGYIIASTDRSRLGQFHGGAWEVIQKGEKELIITRDGEYEGAIHGINLPIRFQGETIGVIGITGERADVEQHGQIIRRMTEILVMDSYMKHQGQLEERSKSCFVEEWLFGTPEEDAHAFEVRGRLLGVDVTLPRIAGVMLVQAPQEQNGADIQRSRERLLEEVKRTVAFDAGNVVISLGPKFIFLFHATERNNIREHLQRIKQQLEQSYGVEVSAGVGSLCSQYREIGRSYREAEKALKVSHAAKNHPVKVYEEIDIELFIEEIPRRVRQDFVDKVFRGCDRQEVQEWLHILEVFFRNDGSINRSANELFIHKNTLQYRINKIIRRTGFDPRTAREGLPLYLAMLIMRSEENERGGMV